MGVFVQFFAIPGGVTAASVPPSDPQDQLQVCRRSDGQLRDGTVDVIVLVDNSTSLGNEDNPGSDPTGQRFEAIDQFLDGYREANLDNSDREETPEERSGAKRFGLIAFEQSATTIVELQDIGDSQNVDKIKRQIRDRLEDGKNQKAYTDYRVALEKAKEAFEKGDPDDKNCRILIWFTDGAYDPENARTTEESQTAARSLEGLVCDKGRLADQFDQSDINTFVVFLYEDGSPGSVGEKEFREPALVASKDAMQAITGDRAPSFSSTQSNEEDEPTEPSSERSPTASQCRSNLENKTRHLGEIISVDEADQLVGFLVDLVNTADGGRKIFTDQECPLKVPDGEEREFALIDAHLIEWISITTWGDAIEPNGVVALLPDGKEVPLVGDEGRFTKRLDAKTLWRLEPKNVEARDELGAGWKLKVAPMTSGICIQLKPRTITFTIKSTDLTMSAKPAIPERLYSEDQLRFLSSDQEVGIEEARYLAGVQGELRVESGEFLEQPNRLAVDVKFDGALDIQSPCELKLTTKDQDAPQRPSTTTDCWVIPSSQTDGGRVETTTVDATSAVDALNDPTGECAEAGEWALFIDDEAQSTPQWQSSEAPLGEKIRVRIGTQDEAPNRDVKCAPAGLRVKVEAGNAQGAFPVEVNLDWQRRRDSKIALLFAALFTLVGALISLVLLRIVNLRTAKTIDPGRFYAYSTEAQLGEDELGRSRLNWEAGSTKSFQADPDDLSQIRGDSGRTEIRINSTRFQRSLPKFFTPFTESRLTFEGPQPAVFWRANSHRDGLNLGFPHALVLYVDLKSNQLNTIVQLIAIVPKQGAGAGTDGAQELIRAHADELAGELAAALKAAEAAQQNPVSRRESSNKQEGVAPPSPAIGRPAPSSPPTNTPPSSPSDPPRSSPPGRPNTTPPPQPPQRPI